MFELIQVQQGLWQTETILPSGIKCFFVFEEIDDQNRQFWQNYTASSSGLNNYFKCFSISPDCMSDSQKQELAELFDTTEEFESTIKSISQNQGKYLGIYSDLCGGMTGFNQINLSGNYIAYVSKEPVVQKKSSLQRNEKESFVEYYKRAGFADIVMSVGFSTKPDSPTVTHYGIFRNPYYFLKPDKQFSNLAMHLHSFVAFCTEKLFCDKVYMATKPLPGMYKLFASKLGQSPIYVGTNIDFKEIETKVSEGKILLNSEQVAYEAMKDKPPIVNLSEDGRASITGKELTQGPFVGKLADIVHVHRPTAEFPIVLVDLSALRNLHIELYNKPRAILPQYDLLSDKAVVTETIITQPSKMPKV